ncbi:hypothetical protein [Neomegalonema sp.]|uniref:hypothetical protein n=1 Tax=Neomegalonema sp. TaxID=2039713 RepID=UPI002625EF77|nr:hypothetical protein [Neomegalonema sp.]MDD2869676.1 hypothetical protein [Neomegalonema sp.]
MRKYFSILIFLIAGSIFAQTLPETVTNRAKLARWVREGTFSFDNKSFKSGSETYFSSDSDTLRFDLSTALYPIDLEIGNTRKFGVDSTGKIIGPNEGTISNVTNGSWILLEASEDLKFAFSENALDLSSTTGVTAVDFQALDINTDYLKVFKPTVDATDYVQIDPYLDLQILDIYVNAASIFSVDTTGIVTLVNGATVSNVTDNQIIFKENDEDLNLAFGTDIINVSSATSVATVDFGTLNLATDAFDVSDGDIANVGLVQADSLRPDGTKVVVATGKTASNSISIEPYDNNTGPAYVAGITVTAGNDPAVAIGGGGVTVEVNSSDWDISTAGVVTGLGNVTSDGVATFTDFKDVGNNGTTFLATGGDSLTAANTVGNINYSVFTFTNTNCRITMTDAAAAGCHGSFKLADLPAGAIKIIGSVVTLTVTAGAGGIVDDATYDIGVGSTQVAVDNEELAATEQDIVAKIEGDLAAGTKAVQAQSGTDALIDGTGTDADMWLNVAITAADASANDLLNVQGTIKIVWVALGDY